MTITKYPVFNIDFEGGQRARAIQVPLRPSVNAILDSLELAHPRRVIFLSGGASLMSDEEMDACRNLIRHAIARFAQDNEVVIVDGGTQAGVMQMMGEAREAGKFTFPLIGVSPLHKIDYHGFANPQSEATLQRGHTHFVLVETDEWGKESQVLVDVVRAIADRQYPMLGILINGGKIAEQDIYLAAAKPQAEHKRIPIVVLEGSGRKADELTTAFRSGFTSNKIIRAIINGGDIRIVSLMEGAPAMLKQLQDHFKED